MNSVEDGLPDDRSYVLVHLTLTNWGDRDDPEGKRYWKVAKFVRGLSKEDRYLLAPNDDRRITYCLEDEDGNNLRPYAWEEFGPSSYFGQDVDYWCELPGNEALQRED